MRYAFDLAMARVVPSVSLEEVNMAISRSFQAMGYSCPTREQEEAVRAFVNRSDVLVILPTGSGKSLCSVSLPLVFDELKRCHHGDLSRSCIAIIISPLTALMKQQVSIYGSKLACAFIGDDNDEATKRGILEGDF